MYFFYVDESGTRDPKVRGIKKDGTPYTKDHLYVLTAVSLYEFYWKRFDSEITNVKLELKDDLYRIKRKKFDLADCEVKSTWLRLPKLREKESPYLRELSDANRTRLATTFYKRIAANRMTIFSVIVDKRKLHDYMSQDHLHKKAYELLLERIEHFLREFHPKHQGVLVLNDTDKTINRSLSMKHAFFQREGNISLEFKHIVEYPFFTDSRLSNGVQLADLCSYNVYRACRNLDFNYSYFQSLLPYFYLSKNTDESKLDGLKVFPDDSELVEFARKGWNKFRTENRKLWDNKK
jgi:hypothetical protein